MAMLPTCPTCHTTDRAPYEHCSDPWHADAHLRRKAEAHRLGVPEAALGIHIDKETIERRRQTAIDASKREASQTVRRAEIAREIFERDLTAFMMRWAPRKEWADRDAFSRDLMMLFRDAMEHKSMTYGLHMERIEMTLDTLSMHATGSLQAIYKPPTHARDVSDQILDGFKPKRET